MPVNENTMPVNETISKEFQDAAQVMGLNLNEGITSDKLNEAFTSLHEQFNPENLTRDNLLNNFTHLREKAGDLFKEPDTSNLDNNNEKQKLNEEALRAAFTEKFNSIVEANKKLQEYLEPMTLNTTDQPEHAAPEVEQEDEEETQALPNAETPSTADVPKLKMTDELVKKLKENKIEYNSKEGEIQFKNPEQLKKIAGLLASECRHQNVIPMTINVQLDKNVDDKTKQQYIQSVFEGAAQVGVDPSKIELTVDGEKINLSEDDVKKYTERANKGPAENTASAPGNTVSAESRPITNAQPPLASKPDDSSTSQSQQSTQVKPDHGPSGPSSGSP